MDLFRLAPTIFQCSLCPRIFSSAKGLETHLNGKHKDKSAIPVAKSVKFPAAPRTPSPSFKPMLLQSSAVRRAIIDNGDDEDPWLSISSNEDLSIVDADANNLDLDFPLSISDLDKSCLELYPNSEGDSLDTSSSVDEEEIIRRFAIDLEIQANPIPGFIPPLSPYQYNSSRCSSHVRTSSVSVASQASLESLGNTLNTLSSNSSNAGSPISKPNQHNVRVLSSTPTPTSTLRAGNAASLKNARSPQAARELPTSASPLLFRTRSNTISSGSGAGPQDNTSETSADSFDYRNYYEVHPALNGIRCDKYGTFLEPGIPPPASKFINDPSKEWVPYRDCLQFEVADFVYQHNRMPQAQIDILMRLFAAALQKENPDSLPPFTDHHDLLRTIDATDSGQAPWDSFTVNYNRRNIPEDHPPTWMTKEYEVWYRDPSTVARSILANPSFAKEFDAAPFREYDGDGRWKWENFMSANWSWTQADLIAEDPATHGSMLVPIILGSDKTTVSVATGQNDYYPLYLSIGNVHNNVRRAHRDVVVVIGFFAIPKVDRQDQNDSYRTFRQQLFHTSLAVILSSLKAGMTKPEVVKCPDGYFRRIIYSIGPYLADYPEQAQLACIVAGWCARCLSDPYDLDAPSFWRSREYTELLIKTYKPKSLWDMYGIIANIIPFTNDFPRADIHELLAPDLLHQIIKGTFKDHLVSWVYYYLKKLLGKAAANKILDDIDHRISLAPPFTGLRRFAQGHHFKQWTGDDSKALMKVYLPCLVCHLPTDLVLTFCYFLDFCYLVRRSIQNDDTIKAIDEAVKNFHVYRDIFRTSGVRKDFSLPRQHSMVHFADLIQMYGAPNGLCTSITESKHSKAVKSPYVRSNKHHVLGQILVTNERLDKLNASRVDFQHRGLLALPVITTPLTDLSIPIIAEQGVEDDGAIDTDRYDGEVMLAHNPQRGYPSKLLELAAHVGIRSLPCLLRNFLYDQRFPNASPLERSNIPMSFYPIHMVDFKISVFHSAAAVYYAPSDPSGVGGMRREIIRAAPIWRNGKAQYDCVFVSTDSTKTGFNGLHVARVKLFFSFRLHNEDYPCAVVQWFEKTTNEPDEETGLWEVKPAVLPDGNPVLAVIHIDSVVRAAHLMPAFSDASFVLAHLDYTQTLNYFKKFFVNKYIDHHVHELIS